MNEKSGRKVAGQEKRFADVIDVNDVNGVDADDETYARTPLVLFFWLV